MTKKWTNGFLYGFFMAGCLCYSKAMKALKTFPHISVPLPFERVLRRLGFRSGFTELRPDQLEETKRVAMNAFDMISVAGCARIVSIVNRGYKEIVLEGGQVLASKKISLVLEKADEVLLVAATAGAKVMRLIRQKTDEHHLDQAAIIDTVASETVDDALSWIMDFFRTELRHKARTVSRTRYSCGYGDFGLTHQSVFFSLLDLSLLGIELTESFVLVPEKSVTALAGIERIH